MYSRLNRQQQEIVMKQAIVREACNNTNVLEGLSLLTKYRNLSIEMKVNRFVIKNENYEIECYSSQTIEKELLTKCFDLTKRNMEELYNRSDWGWKDSSKCI